MAVANRFKDLLNLRKAEYTKWSHVHCAVLNEDVTFNMRGFTHLRFKTDNTPRNPKEAMYKLGLLPLVPSVIKRATNIENHAKRMAPVGGTRKKVIKEVEYWSLMARVGKQNIKVKVILRRVGNGKLHFWSVMKAQGK